MAKVRISASVEMHTDQKLNDIAKKHFKGNVSKALDWIMRHIDYREFCRSMAKYHNAEFQKYMATMNEHHEDDSQYDRMQQKCVRGAYNV